MNSTLQDLALARACVAKEEPAWESLGGLHRPFLLSLLASRGATDAEANDLLAELWLDLGGFGRAREPLLARYSGAGSLKSWLSSVAIQRFYSLRRKKRYVVDLGKDDAFDQLLERTPAAANSRPEKDLAETMRTSLLRAWRKCPASSRVMLQLLHIEEVTQREIARAWGWHESKVSRSLDAATRQIQKDTLRSVAAFDRDAILRWEDFVELGQHYESLFSARPDSDEAFVTASCEPVG